MAGQTSRRARTESIIQHIACRPAILLVQSFDIACNACAGLDWGAMMRLGYLIIGLLCSVCLSGPRLPIPALC